MRIEEQTFNLNIRILGNNSDDAKVQVEELAPFTKDELWEFLIRACKAGELPRTTRPSTTVWRDTRESPAPKKQLKEMDERRKAFKQFKRKFPQARDEVIMEKVEKYLENKRKILEEFSQMFGESL